MSNQSPDNDNDDSTHRPEALGLACNRCRQSKLRCSRDRPSCHNCRKVGRSCTYEAKRVKPGLKVGAVESLHRRLDALEQLVRNRDQDIDAPASTPPRDRLSSATQETIAMNILSLLAKELPKLVDNAPRSRTFSQDPQSLSRKRRRAEDETEDPLPLTPKMREAVELPGDEVLELIIAAYFSHIHHWIPMVHQGRYRLRMDDSFERGKLEVLTHAMVLVASKYVQDEQVVSIMSQPSSVRDWIVSTAMSQLSVENMQSLIIIAFHDINSGNADKAWSVVGSLTRTVEYLQLSVEQENTDRQPLCQPYRFIHSTRDWTELEERRRVFWNVFSLDRLCSITMGWNTSLTSDDVHRRLPCDGVYWRKQDHVLTPYFGIWDKAAGRIGNPIAYMPANQQASDQANSPGARSQGESGASSVGGQIIMTDMSTVGAYAYALEATESMSRVTSYFLQQKINMRDQEGINFWLTRFKELDLRLVHWKMLLPQKWKANVTGLQTPNMDTNLTLAHVTHNASMIMLHQPIAYPPPVWIFRNKLPSACSAETCYSAGVEIATITQNYLRFAAKTMPIPPQYCFCLYIAARMLLIHWRHYTDAPLGDEFWFLVQSLEEISRRWNGIANRSENRPHDLAAKYASKLQELHRACATDEAYRLNVVGYTNEIDYGFQTDADARSGNMRNSITLRNQTPLAQAEDGVDRWVAYTSSVANPRRGSQITGYVQPTGALQVQTPAVAILDPGAAITDVIPLYTNATSGLLPTDSEEIPQMLLDQQFMNMDRVITYDDGAMFAADLDGGGW